MFARILGIALFSWSAMAQSLTPIWTRTVEDEDASEFSSARMIGDTAVAMLGRKFAPLGLLEDTTVVQLISKDGDTIWSRMFPSNGYASSNLVVHNNEIWIGYSSFWSNSAILRLSLSGDSLGFVTTSPDEHGIGNKLFTFANGRVLQIREITDDLGLLFETRLSFLNDVGFAESTHNYQWNSTHYSYDVVETGDGFFLLGYGFDDGGEPNLMKLDINGASLWQRSIPIEGGTNFLGSIIPIESGGYYIIGTGSVPGRGNQGLLVKIDEDGNTVWIKNYGGPSADFISAIVPSDSGYTLVGSYHTRTGPETGYYDTWFLFVDENGDSLSQFLDSEDHETQNAYHVVPMDSTLLLLGGRHDPIQNEYVADATLWGKAPRIQTSGGLAFPNTLVGETSERALTLVNTGTNVLRLDDIESAIDFQAEFTGPQLVGIGDTLIVTVSFAPHAIGVFRDTLWIHSNIPTVSIVCNGRGFLLENNSDVSLPQSFDLHSPYPNPFNATTTISYDVPNQARVTLTMYDVQGRVVETLVDGVAAVGSHTVNWNCRECASGLYFVRMSAGEFVATQKVMLVK